MTISIDSLPLARSSSNSFIISSHKLELRNKNANPVLKISEFVDKRDPKRKRTQIISSALNIQMPTTTTPSIDETINEIKKTTQCITHMASFCNNSPSLWQALRELHSTLENVLNPKAISPSPPPLAPYNIQLNLPQTHNALEPFPMYHAPSTHFLICSYQIPTKMIKQGEITSIEIVPRRTVLARRAIACLEKRFDEIVIKFVPRGRL